MTLETIPNLALLKISGSDAGQFLQGQLTNDVNTLGVSGDEKWQLSGYCNPKGRLLALFYLWKYADDYYALLPKDLLQPICKRLKMFVMRSKVSIEHLPHVSISGGFSAQAVMDSEVTGLAVDNLQAMQVAADESTAVLAINQRLLVVSLEPGQHTGIDNAPIDSTWLSADIEEGLPQVCNTSLELFIPQMLNLDLLNAVNFKKGCYTGQEIVARMHYLGNLKQRMFVCSTQTTAEARQQPGDRIFADPELSKAVGTLVSINGKGTKLLAVLRLDSLDAALYLDQNTRLMVDDQQPYPS